MKTPFISRSLLPYLAILTIILFTLISYIRSSSLDDSDSRRGFSLFGTSDSSTSQPGDMNTRTRARTRTETKRLEKSWISVQSVLDLAHERLGVLSGGADERAGWTESLGLKLGNVDLKTYSAEMEDVWNKWFVVPDEKERKGWGMKKLIERNGWVMDEVFRRLSLLPQDAVTGTGQTASRHRTRFVHIPETHNTRSTFPRSIYTTAYVPHSPPTSSDDAGAPDSESTEKHDVFPDQFHSWAKVNPEWTVKFFDDDGIWKWMNAVFGNGQSEVDGKTTNRKDVAFGKITRRQVNSAPTPEAHTTLAPLLEEYAKLPLGVLKADFFRYLVLFMKGGIYTDTDTACVKPLEEWPGLRDDGRGAEYDTVSDGILDLLPELLKLAAPVTPRSGMPVAISKITSDGIDTIDTEDDTDNTPINLIVSIESESQDWKSTTFVRGVQIVQWTFAARPGHPVLLDTLGRILDTAQAVRSGEIDRPDTLNFTGPGVFSDAVFRYLLARWGVRPHQVVGRSGPVRVGDVLILPMHSFRADASEGDQPDGRLVWHGFFGSWKGVSN